MSVAIVSAIYGGFDGPKPVRDQSIDCEWVLVSDEPVHAPGWQVKVCPSELHPRMAAKMPKLFPWEYATPADLYIWLDGAFEITSATFAEECAALVAELAQWPHPDRRCLFDEARVSLGIDKYVRQGDIAGQAAHYRTEGMPGSWGLWATGCIARRLTDRTVDHSIAWWDQISKWSYQDQVSEPFVSWEQDFRPVDLPGNLWANPWMRWCGHARPD